MAMGTAEVLRQMICAFAVAAVVLAGSTSRLATAQEAPASPAQSAPAAPASLAIEMSPRQPSDAPVILMARLTNTSNQELAADFDQFIPFRAFLTGPVGRDRRVAVTNHAQIQGSRGRSPTLATGHSVVTPLRLTNYAGAGYGLYLPSEQVFLPPGDYALRLERRFRDQKAPAESAAEATARFSVASDPALAKARYDELRSPAKGLERFAEHVLKATLTPEVRRQWYQDIKDPDPEKASWKLYTLTAIQDPPPDVMPAIVEALKVHVNNPDVNNRRLRGLLNNAVYAIGNHHPPGAGPALLKLATSGFDPLVNRGPAIEALRHYYEDAMADQIAQLVKEDHWRISLLAARLLAWAGDHRGVDTLIYGAECRNVAAAAGLAYVPEHPAAAAALRKAMAEYDPESLEQLKKAIARQPPRRTRQ